MKQLKKELTPLGLIYSLVKERCYKQWDEKFGKLEYENGHDHVVNADDFDLMDLDKGDITKELMDYVFDSDAALKEVRWEGVNIEEDLEKVGEFLFSKFKEEF